MNIIKEIFYLIIWVLIKTGENVQYGLLVLKWAILTFYFKLASYTFNFIVFLKNFFSGLKLPQYKFKNKLKHTHLKKNQVLFLKHTNKNFFERKNINISLNQYVFFPLKIGNLLIKKIKKSLDKTYSFIRYLTAFFSISRRFIKIRKPKVKKVKVKKIKDVEISTGPNIFYGLRAFFWGVLFSAVFIFIPVLSLIFLSDLPNPNSISTNYIPKTTKIFDRNGKLLYEIYANQNRTIARLDRIPKNLINATIAIEDKDFYSHPGFDIRGIIRAIYSNAQNNSLQGGSTITQQLVKSSLLTPEPTITRKVKEIILAFWAERIYSKNEILELYFNYVPYGGTAWGVSAASEIYFNKDLQKLNLAESAFLAGLPKAPSVYSPFANSKNKLIWKKRQKDVLTSMVKNHFISQKEADEAYKQKLVFANPETPIKAPHFVMYVKNLLIQKYGISEVERGGLQVKTSLDYKIQDKAQKIVTHQVENNRYLNISNGASLVLDPKNGDILAMVGSKDYFDTEHDGNVNLTTSLRQPGSTIKIVTYSLALSAGFTQATLLDDSPVTITPQGGEPYTPVNYDGKFRGRIPLRLAFANSLNIPAVKVAEKLGVENIVNQGKLLGISTWDKPEKYGLSITLGGAETTMLDLASVYSVFANSGKKAEVNPILEIKDSKGAIIYKKIPVSYQVINPGIAYIVSDILSDNDARSMEFGTNSPLNIPNHKVSVKTGTTDNKRDNWTIGYTKDIVVATWVGNNDNTPMSQNLASGITGAAPMWNQIMTELLPETNYSQMDIPNELVSKKCFGKDLYFLRGTENIPCIIPNTPTPTPLQTARINIPL